MPYLERWAKVLKFVVTTCHCRDIKHDHYTIDRKLCGICGHSPDVCINIGDLNSCAMSHQSIEVKNFQ